MATVEDEVTTKVIHQEITTDLRVSRAVTVGIITTMEEDSRSVEMEAGAVSLEVEAEEVVSVVGLAVEAVVGTKAQLEVRGLDAQTSTSNSSINTVTSVA